MEKAIVIAVSFLAGVATGAWIATMLIAHMLLPAEALPAIQSEAPATLTAQTCLQACGNVDIQSTAPASVLETATSVQ